MRNKKVKVGWETDGKTLMIRRGETGERRESNRMPTEDRKQKTAKRNEVRSKLGTQSAERKSDMKPKP